MQMTSAPSAYAYKVELKDCKSMKSTVVKPPRLVDAHVRGFSACPPHINTFISIEGSTSRSPHAPSPWRRFVYHPR